MGTCVHFSRSLPSNSWWQTMVGCQVLSRPSAAEGGGRRPAFTGPATQPYSATEVDGWNSSAGCLKTGPQYNQGPKFHNALRTILPHLETQIVKRSDQKRFTVLPKRWIVERTLSWLNRCRRLAKDWENLNRKALAFLRLASIRLMLRKLCNPV